MFTESKIFFFSLSLPRRWDRFSSDERQKNELSSLSNKTTTIIKALCCLLRNPARRESNTHTHSERESESESERESSSLFSPHDDVMRSTFVL
jgi:hypothetical protein